MIKTISLISIFLFLAGFQATKAQTLDHCEAFEEQISGKDIICDQIEVPENYQTPMGKKISISYIVIKAKDKSSNESPLIFFSGGPGGNSLTGGAIQGWSQSPLNEKRDIILFDQRGIGYSSGLPNMSNQVFEILSQDLSIEGEQKAMREMVLEFKDKIEAQNITLADYNSYQNAEDVGSLMGALGYDKYNLFGGSYGTRLARIVQDMFPEKISSVVHNSPNPLTGGDFLLHRLYSYNLALGRVFAACAKDADCRTNYPNLKNMYLDAVKSLETNPIRTTFNDKPFVINAQDSLNLLRRTLYAANALDLAPPLIKALYERGGEALQNGINAESQLSNFINITMLLAVERYEGFNPDNSDEVIKKAYKEYPLIPTTLGFFDAFYRAGFAFHDQTMTVDQKRFKQSDIPTLIMVNQYDPVTPPENGHIFMEQLTNGTLFIIDQGGHGGGQQNCRNQSMAMFMDAPKSKPSSACLKLYKEEGLGT